MTAGRSSQYGSADGLRRFAPRRRPEVIGSPATSAGVTAEAIGSVRSGCGESGCCRKWCLAVELGFDGSVGGLGGRVDVTALGDVGQHVRQHVGGLDAGPLLAGGNEAAVLSGGRLGDGGI